MYSFLRATKFSPHWLAKTLVVSNWLFKEVTNLLRTFFVAVASLHTLFKAASFLLLSWRKLFRCSLGKHVYLCTPQGNLGILLRADGNKYPDNLPRPSFQWSPS